MKLEKLDLLTFFKDEYGMVNGGEGIGASGVITNLQMINVVNVDGDLYLADRWGVGSHYDTYVTIFKLIYDLGDNDIWNKSSSKEKKLIIDKILDEVISIRYVNQYERSSEKYIIIKIPPFISMSQFDDLVILNELFESCMKKYKISVKVLLKGSENLSQKYFDLKVNNLPDVLKYLKIMNRIDGNRCKCLFEKEIIMDNILLDEIKKK